MQALKKIISYHLKISLLVSFCFCFISAQPPAAKEYNLKAAFLFNFTQFVEWPSTSFSSSQDPFIIGILGKDPFGAYLDETVSGEKINGHPLIIQRYDAIEKAGDCQILFITQSEAKKLDNILISLKNKNILTISDGSNFIKDGGMIRLYTKSDKIRMQINPEATKAAGLIVSSKLLRVAEISTPGKKISP